jgi:hypothetical protein
MIIESILDYKDLFYCLTEWLSYSDLVSLSSVQKKIHQKIKKYKNLEIFSSIWIQKFNEYQPVILQIKTKEDFQFLWNDKQLFPLQSHFRKLFLENNIHVSDLIQFYSQVFIVDQNFIYHTFYSNDRFLPKKIIQKYGLKKYEQYPFLNAYVNLQIQHFDWERLSFICMDSIIFVKIWNIHLEIDIIIYLFHWTQLKQKIDREWIKQESQNKIKQMIQFHFQPPLEQDSFFYHTSDIRIFTNKKGSHENDSIIIQGWFLE